MGIGDKFNDLAQRAKDFAGQHPDEAEQALDKVGDFTDRETGGKYSAQVDKGEEMLKKRLGEQGPTQQGPPQ